VGQSVSPMFHRLARATRGVSRDCFLASPEKVLVLMDTVRCLKRGDADQLQRRFPMRTAETSGSFALAIVFECLSLA
jgi:hypothetical protein